MVQLIKLKRKSKWKFLDSMQSYGAPLPREVVEQQCISHKVFLKVLCQYLSKKYKPSMQVIRSWTDISLKVLDSAVSVGSDIVQKLLSLCFRT